jgi:hypothetical protein
MPARAEARQLGEETSVVGMNLQGLDELSVNQVW